MGTNKRCRSLGCNYKQCLQKRWKCDRDKGTNMHEEADIQCVAARTQSTMHPLHFVACLAALSVSMLMCIGGCLVVKPNASESNERQSENVPKPNLLVSSAFGGKAWRS